MDHSARLGRHTVATRCDRKLPPRHGNPPVVAVWRAIGLLASHWRFYRACGLATRSATPPGAAEASRPTTIVSSMPWPGSGAAGQRLSTIDCLRW
jgi:hypothetical protein